ncbi:MAG: surf-like protein [Chrysothrix sp. TS-e1954]|nr:MAG: surf-like protein [Chrysothrix sp. TS-e1954]
MEGFKSIVDNPPQLVSVNKKHKKSIYLLAFALGSWQIKRLDWKTELIARFEDRLIRPPLPLPPTIDPSVIADFDYRRVFAEGRLRHDQEILVGPRIHDGQDGFNVITPLERGEDGSKILVSRGWISKVKKDQATRREGLPSGPIVVAGLLREPFISNMFTPQNIPEKGQWYFPDVEAMARWTGSEPIWIEATMSPDLPMALNFEDKGIPIGRPAEVNLRNNHTQYIFTWYALGIATSIMFYIVARKPTGRRLRRNVDW